MALDDRIKYLIKQDTDVLHEEIHRLAARVLELERHVEAVKTSRPVPAKQTRN